MAIIDDAIAKEVSVRGFVFDMEAGLLGEVEP